MPEWGPGSGADDVDTGDGDSGGGGGPVLPDWIPTSAPWFWGPLTSAGSTLQSLITDPEKAIRGVIFGTLLSGIAWLVEPIFDAIQLVVAGSNPNQFAGPNEMWGIADIPVVAARITGDIAAFPVDAGFRIMSSIIEELTLRVPGPIDGIVINATVAVIAVGLARYGPLLIRSALEAIPVIGGPLSTLLGGAD